MRENALASPRFLSMSVKISASVHTLIITCHYAAVCHCTTSVIVFEYFAFHLKLKNISHVDFFKILQAV